MLEKTINNLIRLLHRNPSQLIFECTNRCNADCRKCGKRFDGRPDSDLPFWIIKKIIRECRYATRVHTQDVGEPLLYPLLDDVVAYAKKHGKTVVTYTNASLLTEDRAAQLMDCGLDDLRFSVDYADKTMFEREQNGLKWNVVKRNIIACKRLRDAKGYATRLSVRLCITQYNRHNLNAIRDYWKPHVDNIFLQPEIPVPSPAYTALHGRFTELNWAYLKCDWPTKNFVIKSNGVASMCCRDWYLRYPIGRITEDQNSLDTFNSQRMQIYRCQLHTKLIPTLCRFCTDKSGSIA